MKILPKIVKDETQGYDTSCTKLHIVLICLHPNATDTLQSLNVAYFGSGENFSWTGKIVKCCSC